MVIGAYLPDSGGSESSVHKEVGLLLEGGFPSNGLLVDVALKTTARSKVCVLPGFCSQLLKFATRAFDIRRRACLETQESCYSANLPHCASLAGNTRYSIHGITRNYYELL